MRRNELQFDNYKFLFFILEQMRHCSAVYNLFGTLWSFRMNELVFAY